MNDMPIGVHNSTGNGDGTESPQVFLYIENWVRGTAEDLNNLNDLTVFIIDDNSPAPESAPNYIEAVGNGVLKEWAHGGIFLEDALA